MKKSKLIIVEGPQGAGKTTVTDYIRDVLPHTNLYRLNGISDSSITGFEKSKKMYFNLLDYMKNMEGLDINLLFDRTFFSEENYCRLGKKSYSFTNAYNELVQNLDKLDFEIIYITLYLKNTSLFDKRLKRDEKKGPEYAKYIANSSIEQQNMYLKMAEELKLNTKNLNIFTLANDESITNIKTKLNSILNI